MKVTIDTEDVKKDTLKFKDKENVDKALFDFNIKVSKLYPTFFTNPNLDKRKAQLAMKFFTECIQKAVNNYLEDQTEEKDKKEN